MLLPEDGLDLLIEQLCAMRAADRSAILKQLTLGERRQVEAELVSRRRIQRSNDEQRTPWTAPDVARAVRTARLELPGPMTARARRALVAAAAVIESVPDNDARAPRDTSLSGRIGGAIRARIAG